MPGPARISIEFITMRTELWLDVIYVGVSSALSCGNGYPFSSACNSTIKMHAMRKRRTGPVPANARYLSHQTLFLRTIAF